MTQVLTLLAFMSNYRIQKDTHRNPMPKTDAKMIFCDFGMGRLLIRGSGRSAVPKSVIAFTAAVEYLCASQRLTQAMKDGSTHHTASLGIQLPVMLRSQNDLTGVHMKMPLKMDQALQITVIPMRTKHASLNFFCRKIRRYCSRIEILAKKTPA